MKKTILTYGLISGAVAAVLMVCSALYYRNNMDNGNGAIWGYAGILLSMVFVFLGVRAYRDNVLEGAITFGKAFQVGILIAIISCLCYVVTWMVVYETIMPDFMDQYIAHSLEQMKAAGASAEKIAATVKEMDHYKAMYQNPLTRFALTFLEPFPMGFLVTLISAGVLRRKAV